MGIKIVAEFEDVVLTAEYVQDGQWQLTLSQSIQAQIDYKELVKPHRRKVTDDQLAAIMALAIGVGEDMNKTVHDIEKLYAVAAPALEGCPQNLYPIP